MARPAASRAHGLTAGELVGGRYRIARALAAGSFGAVFEATHVHTQRAVALKVLHEHAAVDEAARERFRREVSAPAQIGHPGIVQVLDADIEEDGTPFVAMELLHGEPLRAPIARGELTPDATLQLFDGLLDALGAAHAAGFVHRDLKPENVFVTLAGARREVRILDFGLARREGSVSVTETGASLGTPRYMSPEQFMNAKAVGPPTDVWAVGVMLYEALSGGQRPFDARSSNALMLQILTAPHAPLETHARVPAPLARLVDRCLDKDAAERPADGAALRRELAATGRALGASDATTARRPPRRPTAIDPADGARPAASRRWVIPAALLAILALSTVTGVVAWALGAGEPEPRPPHPTVLDPTTPTPADPSPMQPIVLRPAPPASTTPASARPASPISAATPARAAPTRARDDETDEIDEPEVPEAPAAAEPGSVLDPLLRSLPLP